MTTKPKMHLRAEPGTLDTLCGLLTDPGGPRATDDPAEVTCRSCLKNHGDIDRAERAAPSAAALAELRKTITAERERRSEAADSAPNYERQNRYWGWTDALDWVLALLDPEAERLAPEDPKD